MCDLFFFILGLVCDMKESWGMSIVLYIFVINIKLLWDMFFFWVKTEINNLVLISFVNNNNSYYFVIINFIDIYSILPWRNDLMGFTILYYQKELCAQWYLQ